MQIIAIFILFCITLKSILTFIINLQFQIIRLHKSCSQLRVLGKFSSHDGAKQEFLSIPVDSSCMFSVVKKSKRGKNGISRYACKLKYKLACTMTIQMLKHVKFI